MAVGRLKCQGKAMSEKDEKAERLAAALRENLKRRKAQARAVKTGRRQSPGPVGGALSNGDEQRGC